MPKYKVIKGKWAEGYKPGDIIELDPEAAKARVELGELEEIGKEKEVKKEKPKKKSKRVSRKKK